MLRLTVALFMLLLVAGCSYQVSLDPNIDPTANIANPMKLRVGLFITEETKAIKTSDRITPLVKYTFDVGACVRINHNEIRQACIHFG